MENNFIERLNSLINVLDNIEVKGFNNLKNLGLAIQQLSNIINEAIRQNQQKQKSENKPEV